MPIYEFTCENCGHPFEELVRSHAGVDEVVCPQCGSASVHKRISLFSSHGKTSGSPSTRASCTTST